MKRNYSLDYSIQRDIDRVAAVTDILDKLEKNPSPAQLDQMGSYILYGKDENGLNAAKRGEIMTNNTRYQNYRKKEDKNLSLDEILENPLADEQSLKNITEKRTYTAPKPTIARPRYDRSGNLIDAGDSDVPGMTELWQSIDRLEKVIAAYKGQLAADEDTPQLASDYRLYQLKHWLIDLRRHQYYLKDSYKPTLHFAAIAPPHAQFIDWSQDCAYWITKEEWEHKIRTSLLRHFSTNLKDYETKEVEGELLIKWVVRRHTFDWQNYKHVAALINNYDLLYDTFRTRIETYGRTFIFDFERYRQLANLTEVQDYLLTKKIQHVPYDEILRDLRQNYDLVYNQNHLSVIFAQAIPKAFALAAKKQRLMVDTPADQWKQCFRCGKKFPRHPVFFGYNAGRKDGFASNCKECERLRRISKGGQTLYDRRRKDNFAQMSTVQTNKNT